MSRPKERCGKFKFWGGWGGGTVSPSLPSDQKKRGTKENTPGVSTPGVPRNDQKKKKKQTSRQAAWEKRGEKRLGWSVRPAQTPTTGGARKEGGQGKERDAQSANAKPCKTPQTRNWRTLVLSDLTQRKKKKGRGRGRGHPFGSTKKKNPPAPKRKEQRVQEPGPYSSPHGEKKEPNLDDSMSLCRKQSERGKLH